MVLFAALMASFSFAFYNVGGHRMLARYDRWRVLVWTLISAAVFWLFCESSMEGCGRSTMHPRSGDSCSSSP